jgi:hypothetical protein
VKDNKDLAEQLNSIPVNLIRENSEYWLVLQKSIFNKIPLEITPTKETVIFIYVKDLELTDTSVTLNNIQYPRQYKNYPINFINRDSEVELNLHDYKVTWYLIPYTENTDSTLVKIDVHIDENE